jgi:hypothetical protein
VIRSVQFQRDIMGPLLAMSKSDGLDVKYDDLQRATELLGTYFACLPGRELAERLDVWIKHSVEACGGS